MQESPIPRRVCAHCGSVEAQRLGHCSVCGVSVCEKCGNSQYAHGERKVTHNSCLDKTGDSFSMIRFVK